MRDLVFGALAVAICGVAAFAMNRMQAEAPHGSNEPNYITTIEPRTVARITYSDGRVEEVQQLPSMAAPHGSDDLVAFNGCVRRGIRYFAEIGASPRLSDGRHALTVAEERCRRTPTAFP